MGVWVQRVCACACACGKMCLLNIEEAHCFVVDKDELILSMCSKPTYVPSADVQSSDPSLYTIDQNKGDTKPY